MKHFQMTKKSWRKRSMSTADIPGDLPIYNPASAAGRRESQSWSSSPEMKYKLIHLIPLVVMVCFFILWCFSSPVDMETKDGRTIFVPRAKNKKPRQTSEAADLDLTVLALESPPDGFFSVSDGPYASIALLNQPDASFQEASLSVSHEPSSPISDFHEPNGSFVDVHEPNASSLVSHDVKLVLPVSDEPGLSDKSNKAAPQTSGDD